MSCKSREIEQILTAMQVTEGAGVRLRRSFGFAEAPTLDPFLLLDDFKSLNPAEYMPGFPWHPHRGIETVTYVISGDVEHGDSLGNKGVISNGDVQWMSAGGGVVHQEMPVKQDGLFWGLQLWVNLPAARKMSPPEYREIKAEAIPTCTKTAGARVKVIAGEYQGTEGPAHNIAGNPLYLDVTLEAGAPFTHQRADGYTVFVYVLEGSVRVGDAEKYEQLQPAQVGLLTREGEIMVQAGSDGARFLLVAGKPLKEPVAWRGPIVMNTEAELEKAFEDYRNGTFLQE